MKRAIYQNLLKWKKSQNRQVLLIMGARQTGKTWILRHFGENEFEHVVCIDFEKNTKDVQKINQVIDEEGLEPTKILEAAGLDGIEKRPENTFFIFDEIQRNQRMFTALKYISEERPDVYVAASGSLMGLALHQGTHAPVGCVKTLFLFPLTFYEFLEATGEIDALTILVNQEWDKYSDFREILDDRLKQYIITGGMPRPVSNFIQDNSFENVRDSQYDILSIYENDFNTHSKNEEFTEKIRYLWHVACKLTGERNEGEIFYKKISSKKAGDYYAAIQWLEDCGLISLCHRCLEAKGILGMHADVKRSNTFKVFPLDIGLRLALDHIPVEIFTNDSNSDVKGKLIEQFVFQQLYIESRNKKIAPPMYYSWQHHGINYEIDFMIASGLDSVPVEVKSRENFKKVSFNRFKEQFNPEKMVQLSPKNPRWSDSLLSLPIVAAQSVYDALDKLL